MSVIGKTHGRIRAYHPLRHNESKAVTLKRAVEIVTIAGSLFSAAAVGYTLIGVSAAPIPVVGIGRSLEIGHINSDLIGVFGTYPERENTREHNAYKHHRGDLFDIIIKHKHISIVPRST